MVPPKIVFLVAKLPYTKATECCTAACALGTVADVTQCEQANER